MDYIGIIFIAIINIVKFILYLFPFWIFDNITAFFPFAYQNWVIMVSLAILSILFWFIFLVYFSIILLTPIDDDIKVEWDWSNEIKVNYKRTFLWQTIRFILWSKNIVTYYWIFTKFISSMWVKLIPLLLIFSLLYFPILPNTKWYSTVWWFIEENGVELKETILNIISWEWISTWTTEALKNRFWSESPELSNMKSNDYIKKLLKNEYQNDAWIRAASYNDFKQYAHITDISEYEKSLEWYINANLPIIIQDWKQNPELEKKQQIVLWTIKQMNQQLTTLREVSLWKQPIELFGWRIVYTWLKLDKVWYFVTMLNWVLGFFFIIVLLLLSWWKNLIIMYLFAMETLASKIESLQWKEFFQKIMSINKKMKEIWTDIKEWEFMVQNWQNKEVYILLVIEIMVRLLIVYYIIYF